MDIVKITELAEMHMGHRQSHIEREVGAAYNHGKRVSVGAIELRKLTTADDSHDDILRAAALFHDIGKGIEPHAHSGALLARDILAPLVTAEELEEIVRLIAMHCYRQPGAEDVDTWTALIQDADLIDHFGTTEIWLNFNYYARTSGGMLEAVEFMRGEYASLKDKYLPRLNFEVSKRIFIEKVEFDIEFGKRLAIEAEGRYCL